MTLALRVSRGRGMRAREGAKMTFTDHVTPLRPLRALVLDHDPATAASLRRALEAWSFSVIAAADGDAGLALLLDELLALDVLVIAADLPGRNARSFAELIRRAGGERDLSIVAVGASSPCLEAELLRAGVDRVILRTGAPDDAAEAAASAVALRRSATRRAPGPELELEEPTAPRRAVQGAGAIGTLLWSPPLDGVTLLAS
jgi:CheY-like chemotaxis protein